ncbi:SPW repeat-containing protein [Rhodococcus sp. AG1013]|uniref:SPW repeat protein n=1 Tax=Rhodococcus sp. AG1013 TaxID=2183996 RepID=UPI000E0B46FB|nr:SPW repeat protein [Rhodococcus sp. AG1013]RDI33911.1 SPW repeat-containing protein [Rhodococcus sp. AG1013]
MKASTRWQDYAAVIIGAYAALSPLWLATDTGARWSLIVLGVLVALAGLASMARPGMAAVDYAMGVFGVLMFISPWVMNFSSMTGASWTAWVVGALTVVVAVAGLPAMSARMHGHGGVAAH